MYTVQLYTSIVRRTNSVGKIVRPYDFGVRKRTIEIVRSYDHNRTFVRCQSYDRTIVLTSDRTTVRFVSYDSIRLSYNKLISYIHPSRVVASRTRTNILQSYDVL